ncbi:PAS/PAC sensor signal transduction histidine kinase [Methanolobus psychrophilus R15]|nr:PAS/PAC sensor signal transduction histidine kinase [Methanolobus psychrophilus R15]
MQKEYEQEHINSLELCNSIPGFGAVSNPETIVSDRPDKGLKLIFDSMEDQVFISELLGKLIYVNRAATIHLGYSEDELLDMSPVSLTAGSNTELLSAIAEQMAKNEKAVFETTLRGKSGTEMPVEISAKLIAYQGREVLLCVARDISRRKTAENELQRCVEDLKESNDLKELFTDIIRHDLLTPAGIVLGFTEELQRRSNDEDTTFALRRIHENTRKLIGLLDSATKLSKLQKVDEIVFEKIDIVSLFRSSVENFRTDIEEKDHRVEIDTSARCVAIANPILEEVFANLLSNAIKYSPQGSRIVIDFLDRNDAWKVTVKDYGHGVPDSDKPCIFERFQRADKKGIRGTGLGLAIVKRIIELHGGMYGVDDNPDGKGSIFWVVVGKA